MLHFPSERQGCWYERPADCCWLCRLRRAGSTKRSYDIPIEEESEGKHAGYEESGVVVGRPKRNID